MNRSLILQIDRMNIYDDWAFPIHCRMITQHISWCICCGIQTYIRVLYTSSRLLLFWRVQSKVVVQNGLQCTGASCFKNL